MTKYNLCILLPTVSSVRCRNTLDQLKQFLITNKYQIGIHIYSQGFEVKLEEEYDITTISSDTNVGTMNANSVVRTTAPDAEYYMYKELEGLSNMIYTAEKIYVGGKENV